MEQTHGCAFCADDQNRLYGHVEQIASSEATGSLLLKCPRCSALYEMLEGVQTTVRLSIDEARAAFPDASV